MLRLAVVLLAVAARPAGADRVTEMHGTELCVYKAKLAVAGYHYYLQGMPRGEVKIRWHGDETQNEIQFVMRTLDEAYAAAEADRREHPGQPVSEDAFEDRAYSQCISGDHT
jgi:hypothetical protein